MGEIVDTRKIGVYTLSISHDGAMTITAAQLQEALTFDAGQVQELRQWLLHHKDVAALTASSAITAQTPEGEAGESSEEMVQRVIKNAIVFARERYPTSLDLENRDRFIDQITRDPAIKPLVAQSKVSRKQIMLWIEQQLGSGASLLRTQDKKRGR